MAVSGAGTESYAAEAAVEAALPSFAAFYEKHNPKHGRLAKRLLQMHAGSEEKLFDGLATKYGDSAVAKLVNGIGQVAEKLGARLRGPDDNKDTVASRGAVMMEQLRCLYKARPHSRPKQLFDSSSASSDDDYSASKPSLLCTSAPQDAQLPASDVLHAPPTSTQAANPISLGQKDTALTQLPPEPRATGSRVRIDTDVWDQVRALKARSGGAGAPSGGGNNVQVAVRVRPLNRREIALGGRVAIDVDVDSSQDHPATNPEWMHPLTGVITLDGGCSNAVPIEAAAGRIVKSGGGRYRFRFDYCFDSTKSPSNAEVRGQGHLVDQARLFSQLGSMLLANAWVGFNVCIFAYGQTGSGKSHTMMGDIGGGSESDCTGVLVPYRAEAGLVPRLCHTLFAMIETRQRRDRRNWRRWLKQHERSKTGGNTSRDTLGSSSGDETDCNDDVGDEDSGHVFSDNSDPKSCLVRPMQTSVSVEASFLEIYNERVRDLLNPATLNINAGDNAASSGVANGIISTTSRKPELRVRENPTTGVFVDGLTRETVRSFDEVDNIMQDGTQARVIAATAMNETSSRSHTIFTLHVTQRVCRHGFDEKENTSSSVLANKKAQEQKGGHVVQSQINLIDLAGSEDQRSTGASGDRLREGARINKSLSALGQCIAKLAKASEISLFANKLKGERGKTSKKKIPAPHIPYRDSVLTWLLKESLSGNSKTVMLATISPAYVCFSETLSTLRYAERAKKVCTAPTVNKTDTKALISELRMQVEALKLEMDKLRRRAAEAEAEATQLHSPSRTASPAVNSANEDPTSHAAHVSGMMTEQDSAQLEIAKAQARAEYLRSVEQVTAAALERSLLHDVNAANTPISEPQSRRKRKETLNQLRGGNRLPSSCDAGTDDELLCFLTLLTEDAHTSGTMSYFVPPGVTIVGSAEQAPYHSQAQRMSYIRIVGLGIAAQHLRIVRTDFDAASVLVPDAERTRLHAQMASSDAKAFHNGRCISHGLDDQSGVALQNGDRLVLSTSRNVYVVRITTRRELRQTPKLQTSFTTAIRELVLGHSETHTQRTQRLARMIMRRWRAPFSRQIFEDCLQQAHQLVEKARAISLQMGQPITFEIGLRAALENPLTTLSLRDIASYHNLVIEIIATMRNGALRRPSALPEGWRKLLPLFRLPDEFDGDFGSDHSSRRLELFRCSLSRFEALTDSWSELFYTYTSLCGDSGFAERQHSSPLSVSMRRRSSLQLPMQWRSPASKNSGNDCDSSSQSDRDNMSDGKIRDNGVTNSDTSGDTDTSSDSDSDDDSEGSATTRFRLLFASFDHDRDGVVGLDDLCYGLRALNRVLRVDVRQGDTDTESEARRVQRVQWSLREEARRLLDSYAPGLDSLNAVAFECFIVDRMAHDYLRCFATLSQHTMRRRLDIVGGVECATSPARVHALSASLVARVASGAAQLAAAEACKAAQLAAAHRTILSLRDDLAQIRSNYEVEKDKQNDVQRHVAELRTTLQEARASAKAAKADAAAEIKNERQASQQLVQSQTKVMEVAVKEHKIALNDKIDMQDKTVAALQGQLEAQAHTITSLQAQVDMHTEAGSRAQAEVQRLEADVASHAAQLEEAKSKLCGGEVNQERVEAVAKDQQATIQQLRDELKILAARERATAAEARKAQDALERERLGTESHASNTDIVAPHLEGTMQQRRDFAEQVPPENLVNCIVNVQGFGIGRVISFKKGAFLGMGASTHRIEFGQRDADGADGDPSHLRIRNVVLSRHGNGRTPFVIDSMPSEHSSPRASGDGGSSAGGLFACSPVRRANT